MLHLYSDIKQYSSYFSPYDCVMILRKLLIGLMVVLSVVSCASKKNHVALNYANDKGPKLDLKKYYKGENIINLLRAKNFKPHEGIIFKKNKKEFSININIKLIKSN